MKKIALIPAYEPEHVLLQLLSQVQNAGFEIILIDDGSGAEYAPLFEKAQEFATLLTHDHNCGKGAALKTGLSYIFMRYTNECTIVTMDADGQHRVEDALAICAMAEQNPDALVLGSRTFSGKIPLRSRFGNSLTRLVYRLITGLSVHDTQTGLRAFSYNQLPLLMGIEGDRYEYEMNVLLEYAHRKIPILEHSIDTIYINRNETSHFHPLKDSLCIYKEIFKFSTSSLIGFLVDYCMYAILLFLLTLWGPWIGITYLQGIRLSNIGARIVSACVNFTINRKFVFYSNENLFFSALKYFLLALVILIGNTFVLEFLVITLSIPSMIAKILTEILFFSLSWTVQRFLVFRQRNTIENK
ncbi:MAG: glycosyltransferase [Agathobacter sp.]